MKKDTPKLGNVIEIDDARIRDHLGELVRGSVEDTLNALLWMPRPRSFRMPAGSAARCIFTVTSSAWCRASTCAPWPT